MPQLEGQPGSRGMNPPGGSSTINLYCRSEPTQPTAPPRCNNQSIDDNLSRSTNDNTASRPSAGLCESNNRRSIARMHQAAGSTSTISFGVQASAEENEASLKRRPGYDEKRKELYGNGIFNKTTGSGSCDGDAGYGGFADQAIVARDNQTPRSRILSDAKHKELFGSKPNELQEPRCRPTSDAKAKELNGSIIFGYSNHEKNPPSGGSVQELEEQRFPRRESSNNANPPGGASSDSLRPDNQFSSFKNSEGAKERQLSGSNESLNDVTGRLSLSNVKGREMAGDNIFVPPDAAKLAAHNREPAGKRSQQMHNNRDEQTDPFSQRKHEMKSAELSGNNIFNRGSSPGDGMPQHHQRSSAKVREMSGSDIFSNDQPRARNTVGGIRKPPGGGSTIVLA